MTQFIFFSGKGGVGKTSMACAHAVRYAGEGRRTLIVTTDPASNLADVFEQAIGHQITPVAGVQNLSAMRLTRIKLRRNTSIAPWLQFAPPFRHRSFRSWRSR